MSAKIGIASGQLQRVNLSMYVKLVYPCDGGRGPTKSRCMWSKRISGLLNVVSGVVVCQ